MKNEIKDEVERAIAALCPSSTALERDAMAALFSSKIIELTKERDTMKNALEQIRVHADHREIAGLRVPHAKRMLALSRLAAETGLGVKW